MSGSARVACAAVVVAAVWLVPAARPAAGAERGGALYWRSAPPSGAQLRATVGRVRSIRMRAASRVRHARIHIAFLGAGRLVERDGNPAVATVSLTPRHAGSVFALTFVARGRGLGTLRRTVYVRVRARAPARTAAHWAYVLQPAVARTRPAAAARVVATVATATSDGMPNLVAVLGVERHRGRVAWAHVRLSSLPNSRLAWVPRWTLSTFHTVRTLLVVDTRRLTIVLYRRGREVFHGRVGVGSRSAPTPRGTFYIREKLTNFDDAFYGPVAFGTSGRSAVLTDWPGGGVIGIHGTNEPGLIPGRISHGCIRLRNRDILRLARLLPLGTPLVVR